ncbi:MAG: LacI family DNA-binding transcriptional regulator [Pseudomonadota bacterium]
MRKTSNIREIAAETGYSVATVSRVMNGSSAVSGKARAVVLEAARVHGYRPNAAARALVTKRSRIIGAVVPTLAHSIFSSFLDEIERVLADRDFSLVIAISNNDPEVELKRARDLVAMGAEALVVSGADHLDAFDGLIAAAGIPSIHTSIWDETGDNDRAMIGYDNAALARDALDYLAGAGHRRVAVLHGPSARNDRTRARLAGIRAATHETMTVQTFECPLDAEGGVATTRAALAGDLDPTAFLCLSDVVALGVLFELPRQGRRVPNDVSVMGFDNLEWSAVSSPPLTTVALPTEAMGRATADVLADHLDRGMPIPSQCLPGTIVKRGSVAPPDGRG